MSRLIRVKTDRKTYDAIKEHRMPFMMIEEHYDVRQNDSLWIYPPEGTGTDKEPRLSCFVINEVHAWEGNGGALKNGFMVATLKNVNEIGVSGKLF